MARGPGRRNGPGGPPGKGPGGLLRSRSSAPNNPAQPTLDWQQPLAVAVAVSIAISTQAVGYSVPANPTPTWGWQQPLAQPLSPPKAQQAYFFVPFNTPQVAPAPAWGWQQPLQVAPITTAAIRNTSSLTFIVPPFPVPSGWQSLQQSVAPPVAQAQQTQASGYSVPPNQPNTITGMAWHQPLARPPSVAQAQQAWTYTPFSLAPASIIIAMIQESSVLAERIVYYKSFTDVFPPIAAPANTITGIAWHQPLAVAPPVAKAQQAYSFVPLNTAQVVTPTPSFGWFGPFNIAPAVAAANQTQASGFSVPASPAAAIAGMAWWRPLDSVPPIIPTARQAWTFVPFDTKQIAPAPTVQIDPFVKQWRKYRKRLKDLEEARLARERLEEHAKTIKRETLRNLVLGITESAGEVLNRADEAKAEISAPLVQSLNELASAQTNRQIEKLARQTDQLIAAFHQYIKEMQQEEEDELIIAEFL